MVVKAARLDNEEFARVVEHPSWTTRAKTLEKIALRFCANGLSKDEEAIAEDLFRLMLYDAEANVRRVLSEILKQSPTLAHDIAVALANDVADVAVPMIEHSAVLDEDDLLDIVRERSTRHRLAVLRRAGLPDRVRAALDASRDKAVIEALAAHPGGRAADRRAGTA